MPHMNALRSDAESEWSEMERTPSMLSLSSCSSSGGSKSKLVDPLLPINEKPFQKQIPRLKVLLGHCLYRRVVLWALASLIFISMVVSHRQRLLVLDVAMNIEKGASPVPTSLPSQTGETAQQDPYNKALPKDPLKSAADVEADQLSIEEDDQLSIEENDQLSKEEDEKEREIFEIEVNEKPWLRFPHLDGYFHGLKSLVKQSKLVAEYPGTINAAPLPPPPINTRRVPLPKLYNPYTTNNDYIKPCFLDKKKKIPAPNVFAYNGVPQHMPDPVIGSHALLGIRDDVCFDRFGRFGPYGLGYAEEEGGSGVGLNTEDSNSNRVWAKTGKINYNSIDWDDAQERCIEANKHRLVQPDTETGELPKSATKIKGRTVRQAVIVRCYTSYKWTPMAIVNFRALVTELSLKSGGEYTVHILLHVLDNEIPIWADELVVQQLLDTNIPLEFHNMVTLWSESQMKLFYPGKFEYEHYNPSGQDSLGVYRAAHLPLQVFASLHPEYGYFWNWEMDMRHLGNYYELFDRVGRWADKQSRVQMWERNERYYIPSYHGSWDNFTHSIDWHLRVSGKQGIFGPGKFPNKKPLRFEELGESPLPDNCGGAHDHTQCGVGEGTDFITFNPIFEVAGSGWVFTDDVTGYTGVTDHSPPRRASIVTASRLSRRLLLAMHEEVWRHRRTMFSEMFPASVALQRGFKAIYAPHPISLERAWTPVGTAVEVAFNSGKDNSTSGHNSPFYLHNEHVHKGASFYYHSSFAGLLWRRWLGYAQMDGRGRSGISDSGNLRGGIEEERRPDGSGRMCLRSTLFHPIKSESPDE